VLHEYLYYLCIKLTHSQYAFKPIDVYKWQILAHAIFWVDQNLSAGCEYIGVKLENLACN